jgi:hypothetical protein
VAKASALAIQDVVQQFSGCFGDWAGVVSADAFAIAEATELAIDNIYNGTQSTRQCAS